MCGEFFFILLCFSQNTFDVSAHLWKNNSINCTSVVLPWRCKLFVKENQNYFKNKTKISKPTNHHHQKSTTVMLSTFSGLHMCQKIHFSHVQICFLHHTACHLYESGSTLCCGNLMIDWIWKTHRILCRMKVFLQDHIVEKG